MRQVTSIPEAVGGSHLSASLWQLGRPSKAALAYRPHVVQNHTPLFQRRLCDPCATLLPIKTSPLTDCAKSPSGATSCSARQGPLASQALSCLTLERCSHPTQWKAPLASRRRACPDRLMARWTGCSVAIHSPRGSAATEGSSRNSLCTAIALLRICKDLSL